MFKDENGSSNVNFIQRWLVPVACAAVFVAVLGLYIPYATA